MEEKIENMNDSIRSWPEDDRPREKLLKHGEHKLSNTELLAILLRTGIKGESAIDLARRILKRFKTFKDMSHTDSAVWKEFKGLGSAKISQIKAAIEIGRRFVEEQVKDGRVSIKASKDVVDILMPRMRDLKIEIFKVLFLDSKNRLIQIEEMEQGTVNYANPIIRDIFQKALQYFTSSLICVHNHPSGDPSPSLEDKKFTKELVHAGTILQINVLDHIVLGNNEFFSFADKGMI